MEIYIDEDNDKLIPVKEPELRIGLSLVHGSGNRIFLKIQSNTKKAKTILTFKNDGNINLYKETIKEYGLKNLNIFDDGNVKSSREQIYISNLEHTISGFKKENLHLMSKLANAVKTISTINRTVSNYVNNS